jgi:hypothetical protein
VSDAYFPRLGRKAVIRQPLHPNPTGSSDPVSPEMLHMTLYAIRLVAQTTKQGSIDFKVDAASPSAAVAIIAEAHNQTEASGTGLMLLPDGQEELFEIVDVVARERTFFLVDDTGEEVTEIPLIDAPSRPQ